MSDIRLKQCEEKIQEKGIKLIGKKKLPFGEQWILESRMFEILKVNIYSSARGTSYILSDKKVSIYSMVNEILANELSKCADTGVCYAGTDESGKGDYFGPLVTAGFVSNPEIDRVLIKNGIKDSKKISDTNVAVMAAWLRKNYPQRCAVMAIEPYQYNELYGKYMAEGKKSNAMLSQAHSLIIRALTQRCAGIKLVITDQFSDKTLLKNIAENGAVCHAEPKAERYAAVAAASILARDAYLQWIRKTSLELGIQLPKGCGENVKFTADRIILKEGRNALLRYAKIHFRTTNDIMTKAV